MAIRYNFWVSTQERRHPPVATPYVLPLKKRSDVRLIRQLRQRKVDEYSAIQSGRPSPHSKVHGPHYLATKPINVGSKLFDLLIPKAIAVVEMDVTETSVLKLFDQSIVSCEFVNELCPHLRPLHREDSSVFPLRLDSDVVTPF